MSRTYKIGPQHRHEPYEPAGRCIYCPAERYSDDRDRPFGEEHIVSEGLDGTLILPDASCKRCETITSRAERAVLRHVLHAPRKQLGIKGKKRPRPDLYRLYTLVDGRETPRDLPISDYPTAILLPELARISHEP